MKEKPVLVNRAPVLTLWGTVVAERLGFDHAAALTLGKGLAGLTAQAKGRTLGIYRPGKGVAGEPLPKTGLGEGFWVDIGGRPVPAKRTKVGIRAVVKDQPLEPEKVERYLEQKFGADLEAARQAMKELAAAVPQDRLADIAFSLYEKFRPRIPPGEAGWGAKGELDLDRIRALARECRPGLAE